MNVCRQGRPQHTVVAEGLALPAGSKDTGSEWPCPGLCAVSQGSFLGWSRKQRITNGVPAVRAFVLDAGHHLILRK